MAAFRNNSAPAPSFSSLSSIAVGSLTSSAPQAAARRTSDDATHRRRVVLSITNLLGTKLESEVDAQGPGPALRNAGRAAAANALDLRALGVGTILVCRPERNVPRGERER